MRRAALLIDGGKARGQTELPGCTRDVERLKGWLGDSAGGAWNDNEIRVLTNPSRSEVNMAKVLVNLADFAVVTFSGHGRIVEDRTGHRSQMAVLGTGEEMDFADLKPTAEKGILLCDACREIHKPWHYELSTKAAVLFERFTERYGRAAHRIAYDGLVERAPAGYYTMYSCSPGECAGDDALNGGFFTDALLMSAGAWWADATGTDSLTIDSAFAAARTMLRRPGVEQVPMASASNRGRGNPFPFAICLK